MKALLGASLVLALASCPPRPPAPTPSPSPSPTPPPALPQLLLRQLEPPRLVRDGKPFTPFGAIQCCMLPLTTSSGPRRPMPFHPRGVNATCNTLWPLASECWMDYTHAKGANFFHFRMGPFYADAAHESEWEGIGGPYLGGPGSDWNPAFWARYRQLLQHAREIGANVEVNIIDTWYCKHAQWGDQEMPLPPADIQACGRESSPEIERYIRKVVAEAKDFPNVVWITDNEGDQIQGDDCRWFEWVRTIIREEEFRSGGAVRLVGTNNVRCGGGPFDYVATHARAALLEPLHGKHTENNERNPQFTPEEEHSNFCKAQAAGLHYWFWRAEMSDADFERTLELFASGCGGVQECFAPASDDPLWGENVVGAGQKRAEVAEAQTKMGERCGTIPPHEGGFVTLDDLAAVLRRSGECASRTADAVMILAPDGWWEEYHAVRFVDGCWSQDPAQMPKFRWRYNGTNPTPACPLDVPTVDEVLCKVLQAGQGLWDCTPKAHGQPILPEGDPRRWACELKAMGGAGPVYQLQTLSGVLALSTVENPMQFKITGAGTGLVTCTVPAVPQTLCNAAVSR